MDGGSKQATAQARSLPRVVYSHGDGVVYWARGWVAMLQKELQSAGFSIEVHGQYWMPFLRDHVRLCKSDVLLGWSCGAVAAIRCAEQRRVRGVVLVAPYFTNSLGLEVVERAGWLNAPWDRSRVRANAGHIAMFHSDADGSESDRRRGTLRAGHIFGAARADAESVRRRVLLTAPSVRFIASLMSSDALNVRRARPTDRAELLELWERSVRATHHFLSERDIMQLRPLVADLFVNGPLELWVVAGAADKPLGFLGYAEHSVEALFIDPELRGRGAGKLLMAHAQALSGAALSVDVNEQNEAAVGFYLAQGFEVVSRSELDAQARPFPTLHMRRAAP